MCSSSTLSHGSLRQTQVLQVPNTFFGLAFAPERQPVLCLRRSRRQHPRVLQRQRRLGRDRRADGARPQVTAPAFTRSRWLRTWPYRLTARFWSPPISPTTPSRSSILAAAQNRRTRSAAGHLHARATGCKIPILTAAENGAVSAGGVAKRAAHGESPFGVAIKGSATAYVSSERDREIDVVDIAQPAAPKLMCAHSGRRAIRTTWCSTQRRRASSSLPTTAIGSR